MRLLRVPVVLIGFFCGVWLLAGCGGGASSSATPPANNPAATGGAVVAPSVVTLAPGQTVTAVDIFVPAPATSGAQPNIQELGVSADQHGSATNTGATLARGSVMHVLMFGPALSGSMQISVSGPPDIAISNIISIHSTGGTPGVQFDANVSPSAALGARTVILQAPNNDITTFTGGLEVIP